MININILATIICLEFYNEIAAILFQNTKAKLNISLTTLILGIFK